MLLRAEACNACIHGISTCVEVVVVKDCTETPYLTIFHQFGGRKYSKSLHSMLTASAKHDRIKATRTSGLN